MEVIFSILIMTIGIVAVLSSISMAMLREMEGDNKNIARQITASALESIFAVRDLRNENELTNWEAVNNTTVTNGVFLTGWTPVRESSGIDGINGTADDACAVGTACAGTGGYTNTSNVRENFERRIVITNIPETGIPEIRKKKIEVSVRYLSGQSTRTETVTTIITNLPFNE